MYNFKIVEDKGSITYVTAQKPNQAIKKYCEEKGCPIEYAKKHCLITNLGNRVFANNDEKERVRKRYYVGKIKRRQTNELLRKQQRRDNRAVV